MKLAPSGDFRPVEGGSSWCRSHQHIYINVYAGNEKKKVSISIVSSLSVLVDRWWEEEAAASCLYAKLN